MSEDNTKEPAKPPMSAEGSKPTPPMPPSSESTPPPPSANPASTGGAKTNVMAILSLVFSIPMSLLGLIFGIVALKQIKNSNESGKGLAIAGIIISAISIFMGIILLVFFFVFASATNDALQDSLDEVNELSESTGSISDPVAIDTFTTAGDLKVKANSVKEFEGEEYFKPAAGNIYLNVELEVENDGFDSKYVSSLLQVYIKDSENQKYAADTLALPDGAAKIDGELASKDAVKGLVGFEVPEDATGLKLYFEDGSYTDVNVAVIDLGR